jgi:hypothetical protein
MSAHACFLWGGSSGIGCIMTGGEIEMELKIKIEKRRKL